ncbi:reverse transcriptase-RNase H-integrase [Sparassis crispa]|uniref:Reverse transcriptase-RNase H-integrase n=1 Tax=Sparassis crispa TaxID=139825 RepID=A0A401GGW3_9APHY|nr:reverse transcriptase-RNase H-integrase [Sparassis crispa]GBE81436.1 reverse transcriptase-RNase H-integrase [Sparassis crispa]
MAAVGGDRAPRLTEGERKLLFDNEECLKCRNFFAGHKAAECTIGFPIKLTYHTLTQAMADAARRCIAKPVATVTVIDGHSTGPSVHPVTAVMGMSSFPITNMPLNVSNVLDDDNDSDAENSVSTTSPIPSSVAVSPVQISPLPDTTGDLAPLRIVHMTWRCSASGPEGSFPLMFDALIDHGSHTVLIREDYASKLALHRHRLPVTERVKLAMQSNGEHVVVELFEWVKLSLYDPSNFWSAKSVRAIIVPSLCCPVILGLPFLAHNRIVVDVESCTAVNKDSLYDLCNPARISELPTPPRTTLHESFTQVCSARSQVLNELKAICVQHTTCTAEHESTSDEHRIIATVREHLETLAASQRLRDLAKDITNEFLDVFAPIPHIDALPTNVYCSIVLKDAHQKLRTRYYSTPRKYKEAWSTLIQQHLDAGRIRPSNSAHASPTFLIPKADPIALPHWVNDYRALNANTVLDSHPLPRVEDILANCAKGKIWSKMDMMNSFFQTRVHPDDVHLTAVTTPLGLYEWLAMPMDTVQQHEQHIRLILGALHASSLYCNPKKCEFFVLHIDFLGHHISANGIEAQSSKVDKILQWPVPKSAMDVHAFLGIVRYISAFLPHLADYTSVLTPLTMKESNQAFLQWTGDHQAAFDAIKALVVSRECLTVIDHDNPGNNRIFITCDVSDWRTGATLSWGTTWESARPIAFDFMQLNSAKKNYPIHEKELLTVICALKKWRADLIGMPMQVYTDHQFMAQYDLTIVYIKGEDNTVADALSCLPPCTFPDEMPVEPLPPHMLWNTPTTSAVNAVLSIMTDSSVLEFIRREYLTDEFCKKVISNAPSTLGVMNANGLWYIGDCLLIPHIDDLHKCYTTLRDAYYWPNMRRDLEQSYIPSCAECQRNKSRTTKPAGLLHPLPVPDTQGNSIALDSIGPLPLNDGFDCILSITDCLHSDVRIIPTTTHITAEQLAVLFFDHWFCENGLPSDIVSDRDKLFISCFWKALHTLTGVCLKLSTAYHPETDGISEHSNKTINQAIRYHIRRNQKGWVRALPRIHFDIINSVNSSTSFSNFQICFGRAPRLIPPIVPNSSRSSPGAELDAKNLIDRITLDINKAKDNLFQAKVQQAEYANHSRGKDDVFTVGDHVMMQTLHRRNEFKRKEEKRATQFFPRWDGPYNVIDTHPEMSTYTLDLPNLPNVFPMFHASELKRHVPNDPTLFPSQELDQPGPIVTPDGLEEYFIDSIIDSRCRGKGNTSFGGQVTDRNMIAGSRDLPLKTAPHWTSG